MHISGKLKFVIIVIFITFFGFKSISQITVEEIISKHLEKSGLKELSSELKSFRIEGNMVQNKLSFPIAIQGIFPDKLRMDMNYNQQDYIKISNGKTSWDYNPVNDTTITDLNQETEAANFIERLTGGLYKYKNGLVKAELMGLVSIDDVELYKLEIINEKIVRIYYIDKLSYQIIRIDDDVVENKITYYNDYRKVGNYYLPYSLTGFEAGMMSISMQFKSVTINPVIKEEIFNKPGKKK